MISLDYGEGYVSKDGQIRINIYTSLFTILPCFTSYKVGTVNLPLYSGLSFKYISRR